MADINATTPVVVPAVGSTTYDKWFLTLLTGKFSPTSGPVVVRLSRSATTPNGTVLMPANDAGTNEVSFSFDVWKEMANTPELKAAMDSVLAAVTAYATKNKLI